MNAYQRAMAWGAVFCITALVAVGCYPSHGLSVEDYDTVITGYHPSTTFTKYKTYFMQDTIVHVDVETSTIISRKYDALILSTIATNMANMGYVRTTDTVAANPDVRIYVAATATTFETYYGGYWGGYWGWYGGYYPPYYGGYPVYGTTTWDVGALAVDMVDRTISIGGNNGGIVWGASLSGLVGGGVSNTYLANKINQMFIQSPYLETGELP